VSGKLSFLVRPLRALSLLCEPGSASGGRYNGGVTQLRHNRVVTQLASRGYKHAVRQRPAKPLSFVELLQRQKAQEDKVKERDRLRKEYELSLQGKHKPPTTTKPISSFRPQFGSKRHLKEYLGARTGKIYPFPETSARQKRKQVYFRRGHKFQVARYLEERYKRLVEAEKTPKRLEEHAKRTAYMITRKRLLQRRDMELEAEGIAQWKEGDDTFVIEVSTADVISDDKDTVAMDELCTTAKALTIAAKLLKRDFIVAFPTETVYGLGANALSTPAVEKIFRAKNRPSDNPLIAHFGSLAHLRAFTAIPEVYLPLIEKFWPGPLTILLRVTPEMGVSPLVTAGLDTLAVRIPSSPLARALILEAGVPIAAPSANASTRPSPTLASHVYSDLDKRIPLLLSADEDLGSQCDVGLESTVVDGLSSPPVILRLGGISLEQIRSLGGIWTDTLVYEKPKQITGDYVPRTPGMKYRHYSPRCPVYVFQVGSPLPDPPSALLPSSEKEERKLAVLCTRNWEPRVDDGAEVEFNWMGNDDVEVARNLFRCVREMDEWGAEIILVEGVEETGIGRSVMERLSKMAGGQSIGTQ